MIGRALIVALVATCAVAGETPDLLHLPTEGRSGPAVPLGDVLGEAPAVVAILATYCPPCRAEIPLLNQAARRKSGSPVRILGIFVDVDDARRLAEVADEWGIAFDVRAVPPAAQDSVAALLPKGLPATFTVHNRQVVRDDRVLDEERLARILARLSAGDSTNRQRSDE